MSNVQQKRPHEGLFISIKLFIPGSPNLRPFSKDLECSNKTVKIAALLKTESLDNAILAF